MRAVAIRRSDSLEYHQLAGGVALVQERQGGMQAKGVIEHERAVGGAGRGDGQLTVQI